MKKINHRKPRKLDPVHSVRLVAWCMQSISYLSKCCVMAMFFHGIHTLDFSLKQNSNFTNSVFDVFFFERFSPYMSEKSIWKSSKAQTWKISGRMLASYIRIWLLLFAVCASEDHHNCIVESCDWSTDRILLPNENEVSELLSLQRRALKLSTRA